jgi:hypothetical protein
MGSASAASSGFEQSSPDTSTGFCAGSMLGYPEHQSRFRLSSEATEANYRDANIVAQNLVPVWMGVKVTPYQFVLGIARAGHAVFTQNDTGFFGSATAQSQPALLAALANSVVVVARAQPAQLQQDLSIQWLATAGVSAATAGVTAVLNTVKRLRSHSRAQPAQTEALMDITSQAYATAQAGFAQVQILAIGPTTVVAVALPATVESSIGVPIQFSAQASAQNSIVRALGNAVVKLSATAVSAAAQATALLSRASTGAAAVTAQPATVETAVDPIAVAYSDVQAEPAEVRATLGELPLTALCLSAPAQATAQLTRVFTGRVIAQQERATTLSAATVIFGARASILAQTARTQILSSTFTQSVVNAQARQSVAIAQFSQRLSYATIAQAQPATADIRGGGTVNGIVFALSGRATVEAQLVVFWTGPVTVGAQPATAEAQLIVFWTSAVTAEAQPATTS